MSLKEQILEKIQQKHMIVAVVGLGYVGLPLAVEKAKAGYRTIGFDVQAHKVEKVNLGQNYIGDVVSEDLAQLVQQQMLAATNDFSFVSKADFIAICVPTPLDAYQQPDIRYVRDSARQVAQYLKRGAVVVLESTTYPGTTEELLRPILEEGSGFVCGEDFYLGFSPERVDPGNRIYNTKNTPKVVGGVGKDATEVIAALYRQVLDSDVLEVSSPAVAEMEKILENTYRNINIGLANEMAIICHRMGINVWEVIDAAKTKPYGFQAFYPGPGLGGHCIPLDPYYLTWKAREYDYHTRLIEVSGEINTGMPQYVVERAAGLLNRMGLPLKGTPVLVLGVAYKQDIDDYRESPALKVIDLLEQEGAVVDYYDPFISEYHFKDKTHRGLASLESSTLTRYAMVLITAAHSTVDYDMVQQYAAHIFDTKNAMKQVKARENITLL